MKQTEELLSIPVDKIIPNRNQPRTEFNDSELSSLAASIADNGLIQPITVRHLENATGVSYELIAGERRWRAVSQILKLDTISAIVKMATSEKASAIQALVENLQREDLNPIEEATAFRHLMDLNDWGQKEVAESLGKSRASIANSLRLLNLPESVQVDVRKGLIEKSYGITLAGLKDDEDAKKLAIKSIKEGWSLKKLRDAVDKAKNPSSTKKLDAKKKSAKPLPEKPLIDVATALLIVTKSPEEQQVVADELEKLGLKFFRNDALAVMI